MRAQTVTLGAVERLVSAFWSRAAFTAEVVRAETPRGYEPHEGIFDLSADERNVRLVVQRMGQTERYRAVRNALVWQIVRDDDNNPIGKRLVSPVAGDPVAVQRVGPIWLIQCVIQTRGVTVLPKV